MEPGGEVPRILDAGTAAQAHPAFIQATGGTGMKPVKHVILDALQQGPVTSTGIASDLGIKPKSSSSILSSLYWQGVLAREPMESRGGRPGFIYRVQP